MKLQLLLEEDIVDGVVSVYYAEELLLVASWCAVCCFGGWAVRERTKNKMTFRTNHDTHSLKQTTTPRYVTRRIADAKRITTTPEPPQHGFDNTV